MYKRYVEKYRAGTLSAKDIGWLNALVYFIGWLLFLVYIADFPPPAKFLLVLPVLALLAAGVYGYCQVLYRRMKHKRKGIFFYVFAESILAGLILGFIGTLLPKGEPSIPDPETEDKLILVAIITAIVVANSLAFYVVDHFLIKYGSRNIN